MFNIQFNCIVFTHHSHHPKWFGFQVKLTKRQYFQFNVVPTVIKLIMQLISHIHIDIVYGTKPKPWPFSSIYYRLHKWHEMKQIITTIMSKPYLIRWGAQNRLKKIKWEFNDMFFFFFFLLFKQERGKPLIRLNSLHKVMKSPHFMWQRLMNRRICSVVNIDIPSKYSPLTPFSLKICR